MPFIPPSVPQATRRSEKDKHFTGKLSAERGWLWIMSNLVGDTDAEAFTA